MDLVPPELDPLRLGLERDPSGKARIKNWASDERVKARVAAEISPMVQSIRTARAALEDEWRACQQVWDLEHGEDQGYIGRADLYLPSGKKALDSLAAQIVEGLFPGDDNFSVESKFPETNVPDRLRDAKEKMKYLLKSGGLRSEASAFVRELVITGNSPAKVLFSKKELLTGKRPRSSSLSLETENSVLFSGPLFRPTSIFNWYVWPDNISRLEDADVTFEVMSLSLAHLRSQVRKGLYVKDAVELARGEKVRNPNRDLQVSRAEQVQEWQTVDVIEAYLLFDPKAERFDDEKERMPFVLTFTASGTCLRAIRHPLWHQRPPYVIARMGTIKGRFYGTGFCKSIRPLNVLLNDQTNQGVDGVTYVLNPVTLANPALIHGNDLDPMEPGAVYPVKDVNAALKFDRPPPDIIYSLAQVTGLTQQWMNDGGFTLLPSGGSGTGRGFRTATGVNTAVRTASVPISQIIEDIQDGALDPALKFFADTAEQYADEMEDPAYAQLSSFRFCWSASEQNANQQIKGAQIQNFIGLAATPPVQQNLAQSGESIRLSPLMRRLYTEVFGFKDGDEVFVKAPPLGPPGAAPASPNPSEQSIPTTGNQELNDVRQQSDQISSILGSLTGGFTGGGGDGGASESA